MLQTSFNCLWLYFSLELLKYNIKQVNYFAFDFCLTEVLPLVEFVLEDGITDEEAVQVLDLSIPKQKKEDKKWHESRIGRILLTPVKMFDFL